MLKVAIFTAPRAWDILLWFMATDVLPQSKRILIVDDDPDVHDFLRIALNPTGHYLESAFDGLEGVAKIESAPWDLVITDVIMPAFDGIELLQQARKIRPETPIIVMTVDSTAGRIVSAIRDNAFCWLQKPFTIRAVRDVVDSALAGAPSEDDIQVISASPRWLELRLRCDMKTATRALHFLREMEPGLSEEERENVALAFREILFNAVEHGGGNDPNVYVTVAYTRAEGALLFRVRDPGPGFSFDNLIHSAVSNPTGSPAEHVLNRDKLGLRPGGFGILLTRAFVDELLYNDRGNEALLIKYLKR
jgi:DNA-binding response OmpR family regulator